MGDPFKSMFARWRCGAWVDRASSRKLYHVSAVLWGCVRWTKAARYDTLLKDLPKGIILCNKAPACKNGQPDHVRRGIARMAGIQIGRMLTPAARWLLEGDDAPLA